MPAKQALLLALQSWSFNMYFMQLVQIVQTVQGHYQSRMQATLAAAIQVPGSLTGSRVVLLVRVGHVLVVLEFVC